MKHIKGINEYEGIYRKFWTIPKQSFENFLFDLIDISETKIEYGYAYHSTNGSLQINDTRFKDPNDVTQAPNSQQIPIVVVNIEFHDLEDVEKAADFYAALSEAKSRLFEKFGEKFKLLTKNTYKRNNKTLNPVGYMLVLIDD